MQPRATLASESPAAGRGRRNRRRGHPHSRLRRGQSRVVSTLRFGRLRSHAGPSDRGTGAPLLGPNLASPASLTQFRPTPWSPEAPLSCQAHRSASPGAEWPACQPAQGRSLKLIPEAQPRSRFLTGWTAPADLAETATLLQGKPDAAPVRLNVRRVKPLPVLPAEALRQLTAITPLLWARLVRGYPRTGAGRPTIARNIAEVPHVGLRSCAAPRGSAADLSEVGATCGLNSLPGTSRPFPANAAWLAVHRCRSRQFRQRASATSWASILVNHQLSQNVARHPTRHSREGLPGIYGLWSAMPVYQEGQLILRQFLSLAAYLPGLDGQPSYRVAPVMGCRIQSRAVTAVDASVGVDETFGLRPVVKVVAAWRAGDAGATLAVGLAAGVADVEHNGAGLGDIQAAGPECRVVRRSRHAVPRRPGTRWSVKTDISRPLRPDRWYSG